MEHVDGVGAVVGDLDWAVGSAWWLREGWGDDVVLGWEGDDSGIGKARYLELVGCVVLEVLGWLLVCVKRVVRAA